MIHLLFELWKKIGKNYKSDFISTIFFILLSSIVELITVAATLPFLKALSGQKSIQMPSYFLNIQSFFSFNNQNSTLIFFSLLFVVLIIFSAVLKIVVLRKTTNLSFKIGASLSQEIYNNFLRQPYLTQISKNSSELISGITIKSNSIIYQIINPILNLLASLFVIISIMGALFLIDAKLTIISFSLLSLIYFFIIKIVNIKIYNNSKNVSLKSDKVVRLIQESSGGLRDIIIEGNQRIFAGEYRNADAALRISQANIQVIGLSPKPIIEALGISLIVLLGFTLSYQANGLSEAVPLLGTIALGAQRLLPVLQQAYGSWTSIKGGQGPLEDVLDITGNLDSAPFELEELSTYKMDFNDSITLNSINFKYQDHGNEVLNNISLKINKGDKIGFVGVSGGGKSTLMDILMGLLTPSSGYIAVDGCMITDANMRNWRKCISHVPQNIYLSDSSVMENIAFGVAISDIDIERVKKSAEIAEVASVIESWPENYSTLIGERGVKLSGGQRQRLGIARALYKDSEIIVFDEATSALDSLTEGNVMANIERHAKDRTVIIVAHRISTLSSCNIIYKIENGRIVCGTSYKDLISNTD